jgi:hypothetical protein
VACWWREKSGGRERKRMDREGDADWLYLRWHPTSPVTMATVAAATALMRSSEKMGREEMN